VTALSLERGPQTQPNRRKRTKRVSVPNSSDLRRKKPEDQREDHPSRPRQKKKAKKKTKKEKKKKKKRKKKKKKKKKKKICHSGGKKPNTVLAPSREPPPKTPTKPPVPITGSELLGKERASVGEKARLSSPGDPHNRSHPDTALPGACPGKIKESGNGRRMGGQK